MVSLWRRHNRRHHYHYQNDHLLLALINNLVSRPFFLLLVLHIFGGGRHNAEVNAKEIIPTYEWQKVEDGDTIPAGLEIRMDLNKGGKWVRIPPPIEEEDEEEEHQRQQSGAILNEKKKPPRCGPSCKERQAKRRAGLRGYSGQIGRVSEEKEIVVGNRRLGDGSDFVLSPLETWIFFIICLILGVMAAGRIRRVIKRHGIHEL